MLCVLRVVAKGIWCGSPSPPAASIGFCPSSLVLTRAPSVREMQWASVAMHYTASIPSMQAESDAKVKWDSKKQEYKCPWNEKVCNYPVLARVKMHRLSTGYTHGEDAKWVIYARKAGPLVCCLISTRDAKCVICARKIQVNSCISSTSFRLS